MKNKTQVIIIYSLLALTVLANWYFKNILIFVPYFLIMLGGSFYLLFKKKQILLMIVLILLISFLIIILLTTANILDIPSLKRMTG